MSFQYSTTLRNAFVGSTDSTVGSSPILKLWTGAPPANAGAADSGTELGSATLPATWLGAAASGAVALAGTWSGTGAAAGTAGHFRIYDPTGATCHIQGLVAMPWAASTAYTVGQEVSNGGNIYACTTAGTSAASGGPTGTGTGITDGTAVWSYVGTADMILDNTNIASGQAFNITAFSMTAGGA